MKRTRRSGGFADDAAMLVALFFVVQALFSGLATGARADVAVPDDIICAAVGGWSATGSTTQPTDRTHLVDCCTLGCPMLGGAVPGPVALCLPGQAHGLAVPDAPVSAPGRLERSELAPLRSRAPPQV